MELNVDDFVGTIRIVSSDTDTVDIVSIREGAADLGQVAIDRGPAGRLSLRGVPVPLSMNCVRTNGALSISFEDGRMRPIRDFPTVEVAVPKSASVRLSLRAGNAEIAETGNLEIVAGGCADIAVQGVADRLNLTTTGAAKLQVDHAGSADIDASNGGQIRIAKVDRYLGACLGRSSRLTSGDVSGSVRLFQTGTSRTKLTGVQLSDLTAELDGVATLDISGSSERSSISVGAAAQAHLSDGISLDEINLARAGRLVINGQRWKGSNNG